MTLNPLYHFLFLCKPLKVVAVRQAQKPSDQISERHMRTRTRDLQRFGASVSGDQMNLHVVKHLQGISKAEREQMLKDALGKDLVLELPEGQALAMKADLGLSWLRLNKLRRLVSLVLMSWSIYSCTIAIRVTVSFTKAFSQVLQIIFLKLSLSSDGSNSGI